MFKSLFISRFWFIALGASVILLVLGGFVPILFNFALFALIVLLFLTCIDIFILFIPKNLVTVSRSIDERLNLGDKSDIILKIENHQGFALFVSLFDQPPYEMQARDLEFKTQIGAGKTVLFNYSFRPLKRGVYEWKDIHVFVNSFFRLVERRIVFPATNEVMVYPSVYQMKKFEFLMFRQNTQQRGIKKIRRLGHNNEFEQIKNYVQGDDIRTINWKATSRSSELMVNQYQEQRSQSIYAVIDKSRSMEHEFEGLSLLDHSINSALIFSNIALQKGDKMGLITFSHKMGTQVPPNTGNRQLQRILEALYAQKTEFKEANYPLLFQTTRKSISNRSLLMLYTNFETELAMRRALPVLKNLSKHHVLVVVFFTNTDLMGDVVKEVDTVRDIYTATIAEDVMNIKKRIAIELRQNGIYSILTSPNDLSINTINKYLELKSKGLV